MKKKQFAVGIYSTTTSEHEQVRYKAEHDRCL